MKINNIMGCLFALLSSVAMGSPELPVWQGLAFEQRTLWATARSAISIDAVPEQEDIWTLTATSSVARNSEEVIVTLQADSGRVVDRKRLSRGRDQRVKTYEYGEASVVRERREPADGTGLPQSEWNLTSRREIPYPGDPGQPPITAAYALVVLADRFRQSGAPTAQYRVLTDLNFYRVSLSRGADTAVEVDYELKGRGRIRGERQAEVILVRAEPDGPQEDKPDFSLLGLSGEISLLFEAGSGLLLELRGRAPRIGNTSISLTAATLHDNS
jgi:hypothetical protein